MICPICKKEIKEDSKFCPKCGRQVPRCPTCNKVITKKMKFCINDGTPLSEELFSVFSDLQEVSSDELTLSTKPAEEASLETTVSGSYDAISASTPSTTNFKENQHYCVQCGALCSDTQILCLECQKKAIPNSPQKNAPKKKKRILPLLFLLLFIGVAGTLGYSIYNGSITLDLPSKNTTESPNIESDSDKNKPIIDRSNTDDEETEEESTSSTDDTNESIESTTEETVTEQINGEAESEIVTQEVVDVDPVEYFILNCDKEYFTKTDLSGFDADMCRVARNGIYARLGRKFQDETLTNYFLQFDWYTPTIDPDDFSDDLLNVYQIANRDLIVEYEKEQGYR